MLIDIACVVCSFREPLLERPDARCWEYCTSILVVDHSSLAPAVEPPVSGSKGKGKGKGEAVEAMVLPVGSALTMAGPERTMRDWALALSVVGSGGPFASVRGLKP